MCIEEFRHFALCGHDKYLRLRPCNNWGRCGPAKTDRGNTVQEYCEQPDCPKNTYNRNMGAGLEELSKGLAEVRLKMGIKQDPKIATKDASTQEAVTDSPKAALNNSATKNEGQGQIHLNDSATPADPRKGESSPATHNNHGARPSAPSANRGETPGNLAYRRWLERAGNAPARGRNGAPRVEQSNSQSANRNQANPPRVGRNNNASPSQNNASSIGRDENTLTGGNISSSAGRNNAIPNGCNHNGRPFTQSSSCGETPGNVAYRRYLERTGNAPTPYRSNHPPARRNETTAAPVAVAPDATVGRNIASSAAINNNDVSKGKTSATPVATNKNSPTGRNKGSSTHRQNLTSVGGNTGVRSSAESGSRGETPGQASYRRYLERIAGNPSIRGRTKPASTGEDSARSASKNDSLPNNDVAPTGRNAPLPTSGENPPPSSSSNPPLADGKKFSSVSNTNSASTTRPEPRASSPSSRPMESGTPVQISHLSPPAGRNNSTLIGTSNPTDRRNNSSGIGNSAARVGNYPTAARDNRGVADSRRREREPSYNGGREREPSYAGGRERDAYGGRQERNPYDGRRDREPAYGGGRRREQSFGRDYYEGGYNGYGYYDRSSYGEHGGYGYGRRY